MIETELLITRLEEIGESLSQKKTALALIGLGSVGIDIDRLDPFSDLDFFVIVEPGAKYQYLENLSWLTDIAPAAYYFQNTPDGYKFLYEDGVFCEFAIFNKNELKKTVFSPGRIVWKAKGISETISIPQRVHKPEEHSVEWLIGEALTNLFVGLSRDQRGEKLSAFRFIQGYAVDRILELSQKIETVIAAGQDEFGIERRYEQRFPKTASLLPLLLQGYDRNRASALAALAFLDEYFDINPVMKQAIAELCAETV